MADIIVTDAQGLPEKAYLSIRVGDVRRQMQYKAGSKFRFDGDSMPRHFILDVFEKVGSTQVSLADLARRVPDEEAEGKVEVVRNNGDSMNVSVKVAPPGKATATAPGGVAEKQPVAPLALAVDTKQPVDDVKETKKAIRHQAAVKAKNYLEGHAVQKLLQAMVHTLLEKQPEDPLSFMSTYLQEHRHQPLQRPVQQKAPAEVPAETDELADGEDEIPDWSAEPGLGDSEMPGFSVDGSDELPDLSQHCSMMAKLLREDPLLYKKLRGKTTPKGATLAKCIKTGIDNRGHRMIRSMGINAADEFCYDVFRDIFGPVVSKWHGDWPDQAVHPKDLDPLKVTNSCIDPAGDHVLGVQVRAVRNLASFRMPTACSREERCEVERLLSRAFLSLPSDLQGSYLPLRGSQSYLPRLGGMTDAEQMELLSEQMLFEEPDSAVQLSSGIGRHWPHARGVFRSRGQQSHVLAIWVNETDHAKLICSREDGNMKEAFQIFARAEGCLRATLQSAQHDFARSFHFGYLSSDPIQIGTGMTLSVKLRVPLLGSHPEFKQLCRKFGLHTQVYVGSREGQASQGVWEVIQSERLGISEVDQVNAVIEGCRMFVALEMQLEAGGEINVASIRAGGKQEVDLPPPSLHTNDFEDEDDDIYEDEGSEHPGFPADDCPEEMPDLSKHYSDTAQLLKRDSSLYHRLRCLKTVTGVPFAKCIKTGIDNQGHPLIQSIGIVAGDAECYDVFRELFDPVIQRKHPNIDVTKVKQRSDMDYGKVISDPIDVSGDRVVGVRVRVSRNLSGLRMPPACSVSERREVEQTIVGALDELSGEFQGEYFPLRGSDSYFAKPEGMTEEDEEALSKANLVFHEPDSEVQLSAGFARHWPDARGVWVTTNKNIVARVNEDDHLRVVSARRGQNLKEAFAAVCKVHDAVEEKARLQGRRFSHHPRFGYLAVCPSNVGTCLIVGATLRIPLLSVQPEFRNLCQKLDVVARGTLDSGSKGVMEVSNVNRLGSSEVEQVNLVIIACRVLVELEAVLEAGDEISWVDEPHVPNLSGYVGCRSPKAEDMNRTDEPFGRLWSSRDPDASGTRRSSARDFISGNASLRQSVDTMPCLEFADIPGLGSDEYPGFPADACPETMPDLSRNFNLMADVLKSNNSIYEKLKRVTTKAGVTLAKCIKTGVDNAGHPMIKTVGAVAGDAESYEAFKMFFDPLIKAAHRASKFDEAGHSTNLDFTKVSDAAIDPCGDHVVLSRIRVQRNLVGLRMPPACSRDERCEVERIICRALEELSGEYDGNYFPLRGSTSYVASPHGMSEEDESILEEAGLLFNEPDAALVLATGSGRDWPEARGVFRSTSGGVAAWINEEDHLRLVVTEDAANLKAAFQRFCMVESALRDSIRQEGSDFARNARLGYLSACPSNLGSGLRAEVICRLPLLCQQPGFKALCRRQRLQARGVMGQGRGVWELVNIDRLGPSEVEQVDVVIKGARDLIGLETRLEQGEQVDLTAVQVV